MGATANKFAHDDSFSMVMMDLWFLHSNWAKQTYNWDCNSFSLFLFVSIKDHDIIYIYIYIKLFIGFFKKEKEKEKEDIFNVNLTILRIPSEFW